MDGRNISQENCFCRLHGLVIQRERADPVLAKIQQNYIDGDSIKPGTKERLASEAAHLPPYVKEDILGEIFGQNGVFAHVHAETVDIVFIACIQALERIGIAPLSGANDSRLLLLQREIG